MTPRISLIAAVVAVVAAVFAPTALADPWGSDRQNPTVVGSPDLVDRALAAEQQRLATMLDARERAYDTKRDVQIGLGTYPDVTERAVAAHERANAFRGDDRFRIDPTSQPVQVTTTGSGRDLEWPQVGVGLGVGLALLLGLLLALRSRRQPIPH